MAYKVNNQHRPEPKFEWDDPVPRLLPLGFFWKVSAFEGKGFAVPRVATQTNKRKLCDVFPMPGSNAVSAGFRDLIEEIEPGVHRFFPIELRSKEGVPLGIDYFILDVGYGFNAILSEASGVDWSLRVGHSPTGMPIASVPPTSIVLSRPRIAGRHAWVSEIVQGGELFISDELGARIKKAKMRSMWLIPVEERDEPWTPEKDLGPWFEWMKEHPDKMPELGD